MKPEKAMKIMPTSNSKYKCGVKLSWIFYLLTKLRGGYKKIKRKIGGNRIKDCSTVQQWV